MRRLTHVRFTPGRLAASSVGIGMLAAVAIAVPASADIPFTLSLSGPSNPVAGQPFVITASGTSPLDQGAVYLDVYEIPASVTTTCPQSYLDAGQLAGGSGGRDVAFYDRELPDAAGNFSMPLAFTPPAAGGYLFCGYTDDEATDTLAQATLLENVVSASSGAGGGNGGPGPGGGQQPPGGGQHPKVAKPVDVTRPTVKRSGKTLRCTRGSWKNATRYAYAWLVNGRVKRGAHAQKLAISRTMKGHAVACRVTASNKAGSTVATSRALHVH